MVCNGCGNLNAYNLKLVYTVKDGRIETCDRCGNLSVPTGEPDVYFRKPYWDENLTHPDHKESWGGTFVTSKRHKAHLMKKYGLQEAGDRKHGSNNFDPIAARHARESLTRKSNA